MSPKDLSARPQSRLAASGEKHVQTPSVPDRSPTRHFQVWHSQLPMELLQYPECTYGVHYALFVLFWDRVLLCSPGWPRTPRSLSASASQVLGVKVCATTFRQYVHFSQSTLEISICPSVYVHIYMHICVHIFMHMYIYNAYIDEYMHMGAEYKIHNLVYMKKLAWGKNHGPS